MREGCYSMGVSVSVCVYVCVWPHIWIPAFPRNLEIIYLKKKIPERVENPENLTTFEIPNPEFGKKKNPPREAAKAATEPTGKSKFVHLDEFC